MRSLLKPTVLPPSCLHVFPDGIVLVMCFSVTASAFAAASLYVSDAASIIGRIDVSRLFFLLFSCKVVADSVAARGWVR